MDKDVKLNLEELYGSSAKQYEEYLKNSFSWKYIEEPALKSALRDLSLKNIRILDAGCGNGRVIGHLISRGAKEENIIGVDSSNELITNAKKRFPKAQFIHSDITDKKLEFENVDLITASMFLFYLDEGQLSKTLENFYGWLKKGGVFLCIVAHPVRFAHDNLEKYFTRDWESIESPWETTVVYFHRTTADYINATIDAGFRIEAVNEPEVLEEGKKHPEDYKKYTAYPSRLVIKAKRE